MEKYINTIIQYEENIFYLKLCLNNIKKINNLSINRELFQKKIKDDLIFIQKCIEILYQHLMQNDKLITKNEQLHSLHNLMLLYIEEVEILIKRQFIKKSHFEDITFLNKKNIETISQILNSINSDINKEDLTTNEELNILLMDDNTGDEE